MRRCSSRSAPNPPSSASLSAPTAGTLALAGRLGTRIPLLQALARAQLPSGYPCTFSSAARVACRAAGKAQAGADSRPTLRRALDQLKSMAKPKLAPQGKTSTTCYVQVRRAMIRGGRGRQIELKSCICLPQGARKFARNPRVGIWRTPPELLLRLINRLD